MFIPSYFSGIFSPVSKLILAQKIRLNPTKAQENFFWRCVGTARFTYNWGLNEWIDQYRLGGKPTESELRRYLNSIKKERYPWMGELPKAVVQQAIKNLGGAYKNFFTKLAKRPKFKKKHKCRPSARLDNGPGTFSFDGKSVKLPRIGSVKTFEQLRWPNGRPLSITLKRKGERWFLSVSVEIDRPTAQKDENQVQKAVGIDLGLTSAIVTSDGVKYLAPKPLKPSWPS